MVSNEKIANLFQGFCEDVSDYWSTSSIPVVQNPSPIEFLRDHVSAYHPVIIKGITDHWPALNWNLESLSGLCHSTHVNITPDGHGDCVKEFDGKQVFAYPAETTMTWIAFSDMLSNRKEGDAVPYLSQQDDNIRKHFPQLLKDIDESLPLASMLFGEPKPEAINLWIGDERAVSSVHKDHFENFYAVISGEKSFTLFPPTDIMYLPEIEYPTAKYILPNSNTDEGEEVNIINTRISSTDLTLTNEGCVCTTLKWIPLDPEIPATYEKYPAYSFSHPLRCTVKAGEVLYIPAMWYHRVSQTTLTIAVNYWYDQRFDFRFCFSQLAKRLSSMCNDVNNFVEVNSATSRDTTENDDDCEIRCAEATF
eukprot:gene10283-21459_t